MPELLSLQAYQCSYKEHYLKEYLLCCSDCSDLTNNTFRTHETSVIGKMF